MFVTCMCTLKLAHNGIYFTCTYATINTINSELKLL